MREEKVSTILSQRNFLIVGLARNCEKTIRGDILAILHAVRHIQSVSWLIVESDSNDRTVDALIGLRNEIPRFRSISLGTLRDIMSLRTQRIAHCRNVYLGELQSNPLYANVDYLIVADLDGVNGLLTASALTSCWEHADWDVCTANQCGPYYDIWALRHKLWSPNDCWKQYQFLIAHGIRPERARHAAIYSKMITIAERSDWIEVDSAFGGLAMYRRAALSGVEYVGVDASGEVVCEHVALHRQIKAKGGRIFINPSLINACETEHTHALRLVPRLCRYYSDFRFRPK